MSRYRRSVGRKSAKKRKRKYGNPARSKEAQAVDQSARAVRGPVGAPGPLKWSENRAIVGESQGRLTPEQDALLDVLFNLSARIRDHTRRMDEGLAYAADDLAVALRVLLHKGRGGHVLQRTIKAFGFEEPDVVFTAAPATGSRFSVGAIPIVPLWDGIKSDGAMAQKLSCWLDIPVLRIGGDEGAKVITWMDFIGLVSNKLGGAHSDETIPVKLDIVDQFAAGGLSLSSYLLQQLAFWAWHWCQETFSKVAEYDGLPLPDESFIGPRGADLSAPPEETPQGWLAGFAEMDEEILLTWYVDEGSEDNNLRLVFHNTVWDLRWTAAAGLDVTCPDDPHERTIQRQRRIKYRTSWPPLPSAEGPPLYWFTIRTIDDLRENRPFEFDFDRYNPWLPGPGWSMLTPDGREVDGDMDPFEFGVAAGFLVRTSEDGTAPQNESEGA